MGELELIRKKEKKLKEKVQSEQFKETSDLIVRDFEIEAGEAIISEEQLLKVLADQVAYMIEYKLEVLLSLMYRLDIDESKVNFALSPIAPDPANIGIAKLVLERQKRRAATKIAYPAEKFEGWEDWTF